MIGEYSQDKCLKCGSKMVIKKEIKTFDGIILKKICGNCRYIDTHERR